MKRVKDIATFDLVAVSSDATIKEAIDTITHYRIHNIIVKTDGAYGYLSIHKILDAVIDEAGLDRSIRDIRINPLATIGAEASLLDASAMLKQEDSILGVTDATGKLSGVVSCNDIKDATDYDIKELSDMPMKLVVDRNSAVVADENEVLKDHLEALNDSPTECLIATKEGQPSGIITQRDIIRFLSQGRLLDKPIKEFMASPLFSVTCAVSISDALNVMQRKHHRRVVVISPEGVLRGVMTQKGILNIIYTYLSHNAILSNKNLQQILNLEVDKRTHELKQQISDMKDALQRSEEEKLQYQQKAQEALEAINRELELRVEEEIAKNREKEQLLFEQSRHATMGELISMIAHQWRQPLSALTAATSALRIKMEIDGYDETFFTKKFEDIDGYALFMSETIDEFRGFFAPKTSHEPVKLHKMIESAIRIMKSSFTSGDISINQERQTLKEIKVANSELVQVLLNIFKNACDAFSEKSIDYPTIMIRVFEPEAGRVAVSIRDNAGGIPEPIRHKIFDPYFSTKKERNGTGLGLYMSKMIVEKHCKGSLELIEHDNGAEFVISCPIV